MAAGGANPGFLVHLQMLDEMGKGTWWWVTIAPGAREADVVGHVA